MTLARLPVCVRAARALGLALSALLATACASGPKSGEAAPGPTAETNRSYAFWPQFPDDPRVQFVRSFGGSEDVASTKTSGFERIVFGKNVAQEASINKPYGIAMRDGKIYVCDIRGSSLVVLDLKKKQTRLVGSTGINRLDRPVAVAVADDGLVYVADNDRNAIFVFDAQERYSHAIGFPKFKPVCLAIHGDRLYAADLTAQAVRIFDRKSGTQLGSFGTVGDGDGQFRVPLGVAVDPKGDVYVVDMMQCRVQKFTPDGVFIAAFGSMGDSVGTFARPKHIAVDSDGLIYVVDAAFQNVQVFDEQFRVLMVFGAAGEFPGAMNLPAGICTTEDPDGLFSKDLHPGFAGRKLVLVSNQFGDNKVSVYARGELRQGFTAADLARSATTLSTGMGVDPEAIKFQELGQMAEPLPGESSETTEQPIDSPPPTTPKTPAATPPATPK